ncbi:MAG: prephenate dehydrogenase [Anaerolineales bacterium]|nr:prephenate dehydrogenase [Anaerolineales bacterium]
MESGFSLKDSTIGIFGLGLMGGSLAMRLKGHCARLIGFDSHPPTLELALSKNIIDHASADLATFLPQVDLLILATPVQSIINIIQHLPSLMPNPCIIIDLGSTKQDILQAMSILPERFDPVGGHPICGKEKPGLENADPNLYQDAPFVTTLLERTTHQAKSAITQLISTIGARLIEMTAEEHDRILASTSHLPFLLSSALAHSTSPDFASLIGPGFRSTSRLAGTPARMMLGIFKSNQENILNSIRQFRNSLNEIESALQDENDTQLELLLNQSRTAYKSLTEN